MAKKPDWQHFLTTHDPDVVCLQETKAHSSQIELDLPDYEEYWCSAERKGYSGTAIFSKISPENVIYGLPEEISSKYQLEDQYGDTTKEGRITTVELENFFVSSVYTPNAKDDLSRIKMRQAWDPAYLEFIQKLDKVKPVIFCGDFNVAHEAIDLARPKENVGKKGFTDEERFGFSSYIQAGFVDSFRKQNQTPDNYTWWSHFGNARARNVGWRIDYILYSEALSPLIKQAKIHSEVMGSDHCPVSLELKDFS